MGVLEHAFSISRSRCRAFAINAVCLLSLEASDWKLFEVAKRMVHTLSLRSIPFLPKRGYEPRCNPGMLTDTMRLVLCAAILLIWLAGYSAPALANINGFNQIASPDVQPDGLLSISLQAVNPDMYNSRQLQAELGIADRLGVAVFRGFEPGNLEVNAELALVNRGPYLLSVGMLGVENRYKPQLFIEGGYYIGNWYLVAGLQRQEKNTLGVAGVAYNVTPSFQLVTDYVAGEYNFSTLGFTYYLTPTISFASAAFVTNTSPRTTYGLLWLSLDVKAW